jgi:hypothetical protein
MPDGPTIPTLKTASDAEKLRKRIIEAVERQIAPSEVDLDDFDAELVVILGLAAPA